MTQTPAPRAEAGFTLLEMVIVLAVMGSVMAAVFQLSRQQALAAEERIVADQFAMVMDAAEQRLQTGLGDYIAKGKLRQPGETMELTVADLKQAGTFGPAYSDTNIWDMGYRIHLRRLFPAQPLSVEMLVLTEGDPIDDKRLGAIVGRIGARGGAVQNEIGDSPGEVANGIDGAWKAKLSDFGISGKQPGQLAGYGFLGFGNAPL